LEKLNVRNEREKTNPRTSKRFWRETTLRAVKDGLQEGRMGLPPEEKESQKKKKNRGKIEGVDQVKKLQTDP